LAGGGGAAGFGAGSGVWQATTAAAITNAKSFARIEAPPAIII